MPLNLILISDPIPQRILYTSNFIPVMPNQSGNTEECCIAVSKGGCIQP